MELLKRIEKDLLEFGTVEMFPKMEGKAADNGHSAERKEESNSKLKRNKRTMRT